MQSGSFYQTIKLMQQLYFLLFSENEVNYLRRRKCRCHVMVCFVNTPPLHVFLKKIPGIIPCDSSGKSQLFKFLWKKHQAICRYMMHNLVYGFSASVASISMIQFNLFIELETTRVYLPTSRFFDDNVNATILRFQDWQQRPHNYSFLSGLKQINKSVSVNPNFSTVAMNVYDW